MEDMELRLTKAVLQVWRIKRFSYKNIARPDSGLLYLLDGQMTYTFAGGSLQLRPGDVVYLPKGSNYEVTFSSEMAPVRDLLLNFRTDGPVPFGESPVPVRLLQDHSGTLAGYYRETVDAANEGESPFLIRSLFYGCIHYTVAAMPGSAMGEEALALKQAAKLLAEDTMSVAEIAGAAHMSHSAFQQKFRERFGLSPMEYRMEKRIGRAKLLLDTTDMPVREIADALGFYDAAYFYRVFEKRCGMTPKEYRKAGKPDI